MRPSLKILVTGATGFIGCHVVKDLLAHGHQVHAISRDPIKAESMPWWGKVRHTTADIHQPDLDIVSEYGQPDILIHLAWPGLPHYDALSHFEDTLLLITGLSGE
jgi:dTDP-6-deoxy-L-talose 4-dehydrogenase (NAD+)